MQEGRLEEIVDRNIGCGYDFQELVKIIQVALLRRQQYENKQHHKLFTFSEESLNIYEAVELSGGR
uniref:Uncharacterized protein n=1 Tax=Aegilops tauschii subsp. strangulata TaxID=200361 RepID=A0A453QVE2_AEGTS